MSATTHASVATNLGEAQGTVELDEQMWTSRRGILHFSPPYNETFIAKFWSKVARCIHGWGCERCCWPWQSTMTRGYGCVKVPKPFRQGKSKMERANRVCWCLVHGPIPEGFQVLHDCPIRDNPACVNYHHLWVGTIDDNQKDSMRKGTRPTGDRHGLRLHPEALRRGEANPRAKLTVPQIYAIRALKGQASQAAVGRKFGVSHGLIYLIWQRKAWGWLPDLCEEVAS
jgi:hypothetical protein